MRSALITSIGDCVPFILFWDLFKKHWADEVDECLVYVNHPYIEPRFLEFIQSMVESHPKGKFKWVKKGGYGGAQDDLTRDAQGDVLLYLEEDTWIYKPGKLDEVFKEIETGVYDFAGAPRTSIDMEIHGKEEEVFGSLKNEFDEGCNFWPNLFFTRKDLIMKTDLDFMGQTWNKGDIIPQLNYIVPRDGMGADTQSWVSIQLRALTDRIGLVPQYKAYPHIDSDLLKKKHWTFSPDAGWVHTGSLSSALYNYLRLENGVPIGYKNKTGAQPMGSYPPIAHDIERQDYHLRVCFWQICLDFAWHRLENMDDFRKDYQAGIDKIIKDLELDGGDIKKRMSMYKNLISI